MLVAELDKHHLFVKQFHDGADLAAGQPMGGQIDQQSHDVKKRRRNADYLLFPSSAYFRPASCLPLSSAAKLRTGAAIRNV